MGYQQIFRFHHARNLQINTHKVPSLKGVWYRGQFEHTGSVTTLEDWFDPNRLKDDDMPTGFKGYGVKTRAVKGTNWDCNYRRKINEP